MFDPEFFRIYAVFRGDKFVHGFVAHESAVRYLDSVQESEPHAGWAVRCLEVSADWAARIADFTSSVEFVVSEARRSCLALALLTDDVEVVRKAIAEIMA